MAARIRKDDIVEVVAGAQRGARGKVLRVLTDRDRVLVEGVNMVHRHVRRSQRNPQGGRVQKEAPIHISNVMPVDRATDRPVRVRYETKVSEDGRVHKQRVSAGRSGKGEKLGDVTRHARTAKGQVR
jgi:large subunit ribosomal protein L24